VEEPLNKALGLAPEPHEPAADRSSEVRAIKVDADSEVDALYELAPYEPPAEVPSSLPERLTLARARLRHAAVNGLRIRVYEVALDLDMSEFHFARQFRSAFGCSPHVFYDEIRAARARDLLRQGVTQGQTARKIGLRRPAELRALLAKRIGFQTLADAPLTG
jgi:AraC-like DNA-binding protein